MSVTIQIEGNRDYCDRSGLTKIEQVECDCGDRDQGFDPLCTSCGGSGQMLVARYPYELNVANSNWAALAEELNISSAEASYEGECWGQRLVTALRGAKPDSLIKKGSFHILAGAFSDAGRTREQVERYLRALSLIAQEAVRREEKVTWQ